MIGQTKKREKNNKIKDNDTPRKHKKSREMMSEKENQCERESE